MPNERFIFVVGSYLAKTNQWKCQVRIRCQVKALLGVEAFLLLNTVISCCSCSHARSLHCDEMGLGVGRAKRINSYLSGHLPHCLAVSSPFPSPFCCLKFHHRNPFESKTVHENQRTTLESPATQHTQFQKRTGWRI